MLIYYYIDVTFCVFAKKIINILFAMCITVNLYDNDNTYFLNFLICATPYVLISMSVEWSIAMFVS